MAQVKLIHFDREMPRGNAFSKFYLTILKKPDRIKLNHIVTNGVANGDYWNNTKRETLFNKWFDHIVNECFYDENPETKVIRKRLSVKDNGEVIGQILCEFIKGMGFRIEYYDLNENGVERHNDFLVSKMFKNNVEFAFDAYKENIVYKTRKDDFEIDREKGIEYLVDVIMERYPNFKTIFDTIHGYVNRSKWLKENIDFEAINNSELPTGIDGFKYNESCGFDFHLYYTDDKRTGSWVCSWADLEKILYDKYGTVDIIGKEKYTDDDVYEMLKEQVTGDHGSGFANYNERMVKIYEHFIQKDAPKKERVEWLKKEFGMGGFGKPMHKHEYGICGNCHDAKGYKLYFKDVKGEHEKLFTWNTIDDILLDYVKELKKEK